MAVPVVEDLKLLADQACEAAEKFVKIYYEGFDKKSNVVAKLYDDSANLVWDGNAVVGKDGIVKFHESLPSSVHTVECIDAQPVGAFITGGQSSILVMTSGMVRYTQHKLKHFNQTFLLTAAQNSSWKITADTYRLLD